ncbi:MAG: hypothetical protein CL670_09270 [Balneola sp.]|jgi:hypothetical protein|nr:hypothetical protein [Balneola sp.]MBE79330.1 hypothetical protein [Balneola sp.]|tara:strand:- start:524 stop:1783 length:1260 start_codon:yes stop_codon:yes gene_type:complete
MFKKSTLFTVAGIFLLTFFISVAAIAQSTHPIKEKQKKSGLIHEKLIDKRFAVPSYMKSKADNDIGGWLEQYYDGEEWIDQYRAEYEYSSDRLEITQHISYFDGEEWVEDESTTMTFNAEGYPLSISYSLFGSSVTQTFHYSPEGRLDSAKYSENEDDELIYQEKIELNYITQDSIEITNTFEEEGEIISEVGGYFLNKDGNFVELYYGEVYDDRYTYSDATFDEFLKLAFDEFFFIDTYNDEFYHETKTWIPYLRTTGTKENGMVTEFLEEYYNEDLEDWEIEYNSLITYDEEDRVDAVTEESYFDGEWFIDYRTTYSYGAVTSVKPNELVSDFNLSQNYPNPFNPSTNISYSIPSASKVVLEVYNVLGRRVATLVEGNLNAGTHTTNFDASSLPSGIYYYKLQSGDFVEVRSMTLIK